MKFTVTIRHAYPSGNRAQFAKTVEAPNAEEAERIALEGVRADFAKEAANNPEFADWLRQVEFDVNVKPAEGHP